MCSEWSTGSDLYVDRREPLNLTFSYSHSFKNSDVVVGISLFSEAGVLLDSQNQSGRTMAIIPSSLPNDFITGSERASHGIQFWSHDGEKLSPGRSISQSTPILKLL